MGAYTSISVDAAGAQAYHTLCRSSLVEYAIWLYDVALISVACYLTYQMRNVNAAFSEAKALMVISYAEKKTGTKIEIWERRKRGEKKSQMLAST